MSEQPANCLFAAPFMRVDDAGNVYMLGARCATCGAVAPGSRTVCNACGAREQMESIRLGERGTVHSYTIVHRSFPGVKTPFIAVVVNLEGGGALKGTLLDVDPIPMRITDQMPVEVVYRDSGQSSAEGRPFISYYFSPLKGADR